MCRFLRLKDMYAQIVVDCQTQKEELRCEYCVVKENCQLRLELGQEPRQREPSRLLVLPLQIAS